MDKAKKFIKLTSNIRLSAEVNRLSTSDYDSASSMAGGLLDIEQSFAVINQNLLSGLMEDNLSDIQVNDLLEKIGYELEHILYHINDMRYYDYLKR